MEPHSFINWLNTLKAMFDQPEEYELAAAIYSFQSAYEDGLTPTEAFIDFDNWVAA